MDMKNAPKDWVVCKIGDVCKTTQGIQIPISDQILRNDNGYKRYLYINDFKGETNFRYVEDRYQDKEVTDNDLVMANTGSPGAVFKGMEGILSNNLFKITFDTSKILRDYLFFFLSSQQFQSVLQQKMKGGIQKHLGHKTINEQNIVIPPIYIQNKIIEILERAENALEKRKESIKLLDELVKSRFIEMFGDPFRNPKEWDIKQLKEIILLANNGLARRGNDKDGSIVLRLVELQDGYIDYSSPNRIKLTKAEEKRYLLQDGDFLFARVNGNPDNVGRCSAYEDIGEAVYHNDHIIRVRLDKTIVNNDYVSAILNSPYGKLQMKDKLKTSAGQYTINQNGISEIKITVPPIELQNQFADFVKQVDKLKFAMESSLKELENNFNSLMQKAFNGELFN